MNVYISADMEGISGIMSWSQCMPDGHDYDTCRLWMTEEVNAAIQGCLDAGATSIVVKDSHNEATNILLDKLNPAAELISGWGPMASMVEGVDERIDAVMLIGYHARGCTVDGTLAHMWSSNVLDIQINGRSVGEASWASAFAGHFNVPIAMIAGDDKLKAQVEEELPPGFHYVITKTGWAHKAARMRPMADVHNEIRETAAAALEDLEGLPVFKPDLPVTITMRFRHWEGLNACAAVPNVERVDAATFRYQARDIIEAQKYFITLHRLAKP